MTPLRRFAKRGRLQNHLALAARAFNDQICLVVRIDGAVLASAGSMVTSTVEHECISRPIIATPHEANELIVCNRAKTRDPSLPIGAIADFVLHSIEEQINLDNTRRAVTTEALSTYRELSLLHRIVVDQGGTLDRDELSIRLLREFCAKNDDDPSDAAIILLYDSPEDRLLPLQDLESAGGHSLRGIEDSLLAKTIVGSIKGEIVNDLPANARWESDEVSELCSLMFVPLNAPDRCLGLLVVGRFKSDRAFVAADLKRATTIGSIAATSLQNAALYEEVVEAKNYNESVVQNLSNGVVAVDGRHRLTKINQAALRLLGKHADDVAGLVVDELFPVPNNWVTHALEACAKTGIAEEWLERSLTGASGVVSAINLTTIPLVGPEGFQQEEPKLGQILVFEDISREKRMKATMVRFMSDSVVEKLMESDSAILSGTTQEATVLFSDIRGFTQLSERLNAKEMVGTLNDYFGHMVDIVFDHGGMLDKFIGDAIMAVFGAPFIASADPDNAVEAAVDMLDRLCVLNSQWHLKGRSPLQIGIGINTGEVVAGTIGSPRRMDYTVIGDTVNLAARIETANKFYGTSLLVSGATLNQLKRNVKTREIDRVRVVGRSEPVDLFEILDHYNPQTCPGLEGLITAYERGLAKYRLGEWQEAANCFTLALQHHPSDRPSAIFLNRSNTRLQTPFDATRSTVTDFASVRPSNN